MSDQTPDSAERIGADAVQYLPMPAVDYPPLRERVVARIHALEERAKAEQAAKVRAALCPWCAEQGAPRYDSSERFPWWHDLAACHIDREMHAILGTPTGGPDDRGPKLTPAHKAAAERARRCLVADGGDDDGFQNPD